MAVKRKETKEKAKQLVNYSFKRALTRSFKKYWQLYLLLIPVIAYYILFKYMPMLGIQIAFKKYNMRDGIWGSPWIGFKHFIKFFKSYNFKTTLINTARISFSALIFGFPASVLIAILINELRHNWSKKLVQTLTYAPHFLSVVVVVGLMTTMLSPSTGIINQLLVRFGILNEPYYFTMHEGSFTPMYVLSGIWQNGGWGAIIYISALSGIDQEQYEAARVDGASRFQQLRYITIPGLVPTIITMLIINSGHILSVGYEKVFLMQNNANLMVSEVISTYVYRQGIESGNYSYSAAVGLFNSAINFAMLVIVNKICKSTTENSLW